MMKGGGRPGSSVIRTARRGNSLPTLPNPRDDGSKGYGGHFLTCRVRQIFKARPDYTAGLSALGR
jgi:hypothetical protein